jgi:hypothetical protein
MRLRLLNCRALIPSSTLNGTGHSTARVRGRKAGHSRGTGPAKLQLASEGSRSPYAVNLISPPANPEGAHPFRPIAGLPRHPAFPGELVSLTQAASNPPARAWGARLGSFRCSRPMRDACAQLSLSPCDLRQSGSQTRLAVARRTLLPPALSEGEPGAVVPGSKLPPFTQHWTRCDLGVTAGSRDCFGKAK